MGWTCLGRAGLQRCYATASWSSRPVFGGLLARYLRMCERDGTPGSRTKRADRTSRCRGRTFPNDSDCLVPFRQRVLERDPHAIDDRSSFPSGIEPKISSSLLPGRSVSGGGGPSGSVHVLRFQANIATQRGALPAGGRSFERPGRAHLRSFVSVATDKRRRAESFGCLYDDGLADHA